MDLAALRTAVRTRANVPPTDGIWTDAFVNDAINEALADISMTEMWPWLEVGGAVAWTQVLEGGVQKVAILVDSLVPTGHEFLAVKSVSWRGEEHNPATVLDLDNYTNVMAERGSIYVVSNSQTFQAVIRLRPEPSSTSEEEPIVRFFVTDKVLTLDADEPIMPEFGQRAALVRLACAVGFESLSNRSAAELHRVAAERGIDLLRRGSSRYQLGPRSPRLRAGAQF